MEKLQRVGRGLAVSTSAYLTNIASRCGFSFAHYRIQQKTKVPEAASKVLRLLADSRHVLGSRMQAYPEK